MTNVVVCGSRGWSDKKRLHVILNASTRTLPDVEFWVASFRGVARLTAEWCGSYGVPCRIFRYSAADIEGLYMHNQEVVAASPDLVLAFPGRLCTHDMMYRAGRAGIEVREISWTDDGQPVLVEYVPKHRT